MHLRMVFCVSVCFLFLFCYFFFFEGGKERWERGKKTGKEARSANTQKKQRVKKERIEISLTLHALGGIVPLLMYCARFWHVKRSKIAVGRPLSERAARAPWGATTRSAAATAAARRKRREKKVMMLLLLFLFWSGKKKGKSEGDEKAEREKAVFVLEKREERREKRKRWGGRRKKKKLKTNDEQKREKKKQKLVARAALIFPRIFYFQSCILFRMMF